MKKPLTNEIFQKPIELVTQRDLEAYFQQERDETLYLEFKSFTDKTADNRGKEAKENERIKGVIKTIDAFLNSSGGLLIWGAPESVEVTRDSKKVKICIGSLSPVPDFYDRDAFINKLASKIEPLPQGIRMQSIKVNNGYVYLFEVPESLNKPHQFDGRYYVRMDTRTDTAPHYLVYALCRQVKNPELEMKVTFRSASIYEAGRPAIGFDISIEISNQTQTVNDYDIYVKSSISNGVVNTSRHSEAWVDLTIANILSFGLPVKRNFFAYVNIPVNDAEGEIIEFWYGGRNSLAKRLVYKLFFVNERKDGIYIKYDIKTEVLEQ